MFFYDSCLMSCLYLGLGLCYGFRGYSHRGIHSHIELRGTQAGGGGGGVFSLLLFSFSAPFLVLGGGPDRPPRRKKKASTGEADLPDLFVLHRAPVCSHLYSVLVACSWKR